LLAPFKAALDLFQQRRGKAIVERQSAQVQQTDFR
jgi:hypothetical protein